MTLWRFHLARSVIHFGIRLMPSGRAKAELFQLLDCWATKVRSTVA